MKKHLLTFTVVAALFSSIGSSCSKDNSDESSDETKTDLLVKSTWKFDKLEAGIVGDISSQIDDCVKDNLLTFTATASTSTSGNGIIDEGATKCESSDPQTGAFTWELISNGTVLRTSEPLLPGGSTDFNIVSVSAANLVLSQQMTIDPFPATTVTLTLKH